jgi:hypothetical protein
VFHDLAHAHIGPSRDLQVVSRQLPGGPMKVRRYDHGISGMIVEELPMAFRFGLALSFEF